MMAEHQRRLLRMGTTANKTSGMALIELSESFLRCLGFACSLWFQVY